MYSQAQNYGLDSLSSWRREGLLEIDKQSFNDVWGWHNGLGQEYAIMGSLDSIYFIDITDPQKPILRDVEAGKSRFCVHRDFKTLDNYAYAVADEGESSLQIFDLSYLPDSVHKVYDSDKLIIRSHNIFIDAEKLYCGTVRTGKGDYVPMRVLSLKDREQPELLCDVRGPEIGGQSLFNEVHDMYAVNDTVYCSTGYKGLFALNYKKDSTLKTVEDSTWYEFNHSYEMIQWGSLVNYPSQGYNHSSWLDKNSRYMVMADETPGTKLKIVEFTWEDIPQVLSTFGSESEKGSLPHNPFILNNRVYISYYHQGVLVYDIADPENPKEIAHWDTYPDNLDFDGMYGCWGVYPFLPSGNIIASDQIYGLFVFDLSVSIDDNSNPTNLQVFPNPIKSGAFNVQLFSGADDVSLITIFNTTGQLVYTKETVLKQVNINRNELGASGVYVVKVRSGKQIGQCKLILE
ncbi:MAG: choice-of-anchor B family protein [Bacteroidia bacterium]